MGGAIEGVHLMRLGNGQSGLSICASHRNICKFTAGFKHFLQFSHLLLDMGN